MFEVMSSGGNLITHWIKSNINKPVIAVKNHNSPEKLKFMNTWERLLNHFYPNNLIVDISINNIHIIVMHIIIINNMHSGNSLGTKTESCLPLLLEVQPISAKENKSHSWIQTPANSMKAASYFKYFGHVHTGEVSVKSNVLQKT